MKEAIRPVRKLVGEIRVPGDKSISHRAVMLGALAEGTTVISGFLEGADCLSTIGCFRSLGVDIVVAGGGSVTVSGKGLQGLMEPADVLNCGNSGTTTRLLMGILAGQPFYATLTGDDSLRERPMARVAIPLRQMGAKISGRQNGTKAPLTVEGGQLQALHYRSPVASAQLKSAVLLAGLFAEGETIVSEPYKSRDHTERMLSFFGAQVSSTDNTAQVTGRPRLQGRPVVVPGDISSAAFFMVAASIVAKGEVVIRNVGINHTRDGIIEVLRRMGAKIELLDYREEAGEPVADLVVQPARLRGVTIDGTIMPRLVDEIPVLAVAAAAAEGETLITGAAELRIKETDRLTAVATELGRLGAVVEELPDGLRISGGKPLSGAICQSYGDHRMAMAMAVAGLIAAGETIIEEAECVAVSYPDFFQDLRRLTK